MVAKLWTLVIPKPDSSVALHFRSPVAMDDAVCVCGGGVSVQRLVKAKPCVQRGPFKS